MAAFSAVVIFATIILNLYPATTLRNLMIDAKKGEMLERSRIMSSTLQNVDLQQPDSIAEALSRMFISDTERVLVTNAIGMPIYSTYDYVKNENTEEGIRSALLGFDIFRCNYDENSFVSSVIMPVSRFGIVQGTVCITQEESDSSQLLRDIRGNIINMSVAIVLFSGALIVLFVSMFSNKIKALIQGVKQVGSGNYSYKVREGGIDEFSDVAREFNQLSEKLQNVERIRQEFVSNASHELKTPLASIKLLSDSIVQTDSMSRADTLDFLKDINDEIDRLIRITENLLYITKTDSRPIVSREVCNAGKIARRCCELLTASAGHSGVGISVRELDECRVMANSDMLHQVMFNIFENAIKYNREDGTVRATIRKNGSDCQIEIEDTGIGMPEEELGMIFQRFYRIDKARSRAIGGTGLGLSIVYDNITLIGGTIEVVSQVDVGSRFTIKIPLA